MAIRFNLAEHVHTDIVSHSTNGFPTRDGKEFLEFLKAASASGPNVPSPKPIEVFLGSHPAALKFVQRRTTCCGTSLAREAFFAVTAYSFTNAAGETKFGRYRILPELGTEFFTDAGNACEGAAGAPVYSTMELHARVANMGQFGPFKVLVAEDVPRPKTPPTMPPSLGRKAESWWSLARSS